MRERSLIINDNPVERCLLDRTERGFGYEPGLALLDESGHVRALADIEAEAIRFAISHYRGQMSEVARRLPKSTQFSRNQTKFSRNYLLGCCRDGRIHGGFAPGWRRWIST